MKIGIYGGTYNPPHLGHLAAARTAIDALKLDKLLLMPAAVPPHKALPENTPSQEHRLAMVEKLADAMDLPGVVEVSTLELEREGKSYTSETLEEAVAAHGDGHVSDPPPVARRQDHPAAGQDLRLRPDRAGRGGGFCPPAGVFDPGVPRRRGDHYPARPDRCVLHPAAGAAGPGEGAGVPAPPPPSCGSCWSGGRGGSTCSPLCTAIF